jgi:Mg2+ and Co2+ transporter CorA
MSVDAIHSRPGGRDETVDIARWTPREIPADELLWVDLTDPSTGEVDDVARALDLDEETKELLGVDSEGPRVAVRESGVEVVVRVPGDGLDDDPQALRIIVGNEWIVTAHQVPARFLEEHRAGIQDQREVGRLSPVQFLVAVLNWQVDAYIRAAGLLEREVDTLDDAALRTEHDLLDRLVAMRRRIARYRRMLAPHREIFAELARPDLLPDLEEHERMALEAVGERLERASEAIGNAREMLIGTFDVHMTRTAQRTNDVMKVLTLASVILLPSVVLAGVMGMNFQVGFFDDPQLFWVVLVVMGAMALGTVVVARWRGWL